jgi:putative NIF3 family GTP cyclohydrolase 1 type 2
MQKEINPDLLHFAYGPQEIRTIGIISGGAQKNVNQAVAEGLDLFLTGEVSEHILNYVKEEGIHFVAAGHYATERFGVLALGSHLAERFDIEVEFVDIPNPV